MDANQQSSESPQKSIVFILWIVFLCFLLWVIYPLYQALKASQPPVQAAVIAGIVSVASLILNSIYQKTREIEAEHRKQKAKVYEKFIEFYFKEIFADKLGNDSISNEKTPNFNIEFSKMIVWGSDKVLQEYHDHKTQIILSQSKKLEEAEKKIEIRKSVISFENLLYAMREDLEHDRKTLKEGDLIRLFIDSNKEDKK